MTKEELALEITMISAKLNAWLFNIGFFAGQAFLCFLVTLAMWKITIVTAFGCFFIMATIGCYQYREYLGNKLNKYLEEFNKDINNGNLE